MTKKRFPLKTSLALALASLVFLSASLAHSFATTISSNYVSKSAGLQAGDTVTVTMSIFDTSGCLWQGISLLSVSVLFDSDSVRVRSEGSEFDAQGLCPLQLGRARAISILCPASTNMTIAHRHVQSDPLGLAEHTALPDGNRDQCGITAGVDLSGRHCGFTKVNGSSV